MIMEFAKRLMPATEHVGHESRSLKHCIKDFQQDESGGITVLTILLLVAMLVMGGMAVDFMRFESRRVELQSVLDRAVISAASLSQNVPAEELIYEYVEKAGFDRSDVTPIVVENSRRAKTIAADATVDVSTVYLQLIGINQLSAPAYSEANEGVNQVEVSLVLDYSASMRSGGTTGRITEFGDQRGKIGDLQDAASAFAAELLRPEYEGRFSLNIVPYGGHVNPGEAMFDHLSSVRNPAFYIEDSEFDLNVDAPFIVEDSVFWSGGANEGFGGYFVYAGEDGKFGTGYDMTTGSADTDVNLSLMVGVDGVLGTDDDLTPDVISNEIANIFGPDMRYGTADDDQTDTGDVSRIAYRYQQTSHCNEIASSDWTNSRLPSAGQDQVPVFMRYGYNNWEIEQQVRGWGWCPNDAMRIQYAVQDATKVDTFFEEITTFDGTGTDIAMKWGLSLLDPDARDAFTHLNTQFDPFTGDRIVPDASVGRPADWDDASTDKILILMTDGGITQQFRPRAPEDLDNLSMLSKKGGEGNDRTVASRSATRLRMLAMCDFAKDESRDVEIFTVAFETNASQGADMELCATDPAHYSETSAGGLTDVFVDIARQITELRLTQ